MFRQGLALLALTVLIVAALPAHPALAQSTDPSSDQAAADEIVEKLNAWRVSEGTWPLKVNPTLEALALSQAQYLLTLPDIPDGGDVHLGRTGEGPKARARTAPYNWPTYDRPEQIALDEIAYVGHTADAALGFWQSSSVHRASSLNPTYREVGVAALPHTFGHLYIVVLGARPNVLPVTYDSASGVLYLTNERYLGARGESWIKDVTEVKVFDAEGKPLWTGWRPWQPTIRLSSYTGDMVFVSFRDSQVEVITLVMLARDTVMLTPGVAVPTTAPPAAMVESNTATPAPTATATPSAAALPSVSIPTPTPGTSTTTDGAEDIAIIYDSRSLAILNTSGAARDLSRLELAAGTTTFPITRWQSEFLAAPLDAFPADDCLQTWSWNEQEDVPKPPDCDNQRGVRLVAPEARFWLTQEFAVRWDGIVVATCPAGAGRCPVDLPG
ncbi:CAP domain-containing protein [Aggregatilinea lenta]|uniref:CAP domain-containing protein n=1 Tax=Aggregatilinea lenta TaxID=913108 RepID=UPI000E5C0462|nr:CAP domain-containing protein [Aggregatilinea lenta]